MRESTRHKSICSITIKHVMLSSLWASKSLLFSIIPSGTPFTYIWACVEKLFVRSNYFGGYYE